jgi:D-alanyl-lipoteichoic acid acyltransferase DltB (MBOAT superfamily)
MLFNSPDFFVFIIAFFILWPILRRYNGSRYLGLIIASFVFYGWWDWRFVSLLLLNGIVSFSGGLAIARFPRFRKSFLITSISLCAGTLIIFKYLDFGIKNLNWILEALGISQHINPVRLTLPIGISFYTFESISYIIDVYLNKLNPTRNIAQFLAYLSMFPQLLAGPIVRAKDLLPQLEKISPTTEQNRWDGLQLVIHGFFKKVVIADNIAIMVNSAFASPVVNSSTIYWWVIMAMFAFQIYCDFSGYSDIARGMARWMGYEIPLNFNHPYISSSFREFWTRWHISLSTWFRDYIYIPLGGSRAGKGRSFVNLWVAMLVSGLWHGAAWTFIAWAALHSLYVSIERITDWPGRLGRIKGGKHLAALAVFLMVCVAWVFFRAKSFTQATSILSAMFGFDISWNVARNCISTASLLCLGIILLRELYFHFGLDKTNWMTAKVSVLTQSVAASIMVVLCVILRGPGEAFIYFQF